ncbi:stage II sporulation protein M [Lentibacillus sp. N15]|uniref:stage II sporulation protein M n=1 Tax=Lentibacillus songyuanensis TaxID=3136161 RepID=UPI0031BB097F
MYQKKTLTVNHIREHAAIYLFMIILFLTGIVFGAIIVNSMNFVQKQDLFFYLERFFGNIMDKEQVGSMAILKESFFYHTKYLLLLFILGLSVIGLPIVWILLFLKGLVVGFSVGFIVNQLGLKGLALATLAIAPQNLLIIPIYIVAGSISMIFSLTLINKLFSSRLSQSILPPFGKYVTIFALLLGLCVIAAGMEAFVSNEAFESVVKALYKQ